MNRLIKGELAEFFSTRYKTYVNAGYDTRDAWDYAMEDLAGYKQDFGIDGRIGYER